jgi:hypothetical protein
MYIAWRAVIHVCFSSTQSALVHDKRKKGETNLGNASTLFKAEFIRLVNEHVRAHGNVLCIRTTICQSKHGITLLEATLTLGSKFLDYTTEFHTEGCGSLRRKRVLAFSLQEIHTVETECLYTDQGLCCCGLWTLNLANKERGCWTFAAFDFWVLELCLVVAAHFFVKHFDAGYRDVPTARMVVIVIDLQFDVW